MNSVLCAILQKKKKMIVLFPVITFDRDFLGSVSAGVPVGSAARLLGLLALPFGFTTRACPEVLAFPPSYRQPGSCIELFDRRGLPRLVCPFFPHTPGIKEPDPSRMAS